MPAAPITPEHVLAAADVLRGVAHRTPVVTSRRLDVELGLRLYLKCENLQRTGAFKFRGAYHAISRLAPEARERGVVAYSSGNHAQAIACAGALLGVPTTIVMPTDAPASKRAATEGYGARVVEYDRASEDRIEIGARIAAESGASVIPPYDHPDIVAGQGTAALELHEEVPDLDVVVACLGGGGLLAGTALATAHRAPACRVYGAEPAAGDDGKRSFDTGEIIRIPTPATIADGAQTQFLGDLTFPIIRERVTDIVTVSDDELVEAMCSLASTTKLLAEPTGVLSYAAVRQMAPQWQGARVGVIVSGGNVDLDRFAALVAGRCRARS
ncbi:threo-3-hydroxy-L-aspartate ammonia-lyase [Agilicoccus flavus]|uniref:threo-3-hydroxy-L-aspartate ammonia-lyase n=1 Tax=Agilicoccus flavus TaxID=2775968 RepID=UPI001CF64A3A|nr:threo-3-hydroxy-L-aspartate ammonia-lyase [Agilicoccus flavus]